MALVAVGCLLLSACGLLPDAGPVTTVVARPGEVATQDTYFYPPAAAKGADRVAIVKGFLVAMQANPLTTGPARSFLSEHARATWRPAGGTIIYDAATVDLHGDQVSARLSDAHRLDASGIWQPGPAHSTTIHFSMVREHGEWRIDNPVSALMVRSSYFEARFAPYDLYFLDGPGRVLVPQTVYAPKGQLAASTLVRGLLAGPGSMLSGVAHAAFPAGTTLDPSVVVSDNGVAEVPLSDDVLKLSPGERVQALIELAWTLAQVPGIDRARITVNGTPLAIPDGRTDLGVEDGVELAPTGLGSTRELIGIRSGRVVAVGGGKVGPVAGEFGRRGFALRSLALDRSGSTIVGVAQSGTTAYTGTVGEAGRITRLFGGGSDLLRPWIDLFGNVWLIDRTSSGAVVHVIEDGHDHVIPFPGVSGQAVTSFAVSPDGTRIAVGLADRIRPRVVVATIERGAGGAVTGAGTTASVPVTSYDQAHELGPVADLGWRTPTMLAVLTRPDASTSRVVYAMADGSPGDNDPPQPDPFPGAAEQIVVSADNGVSVMLLDDRGRLDRLDAAGKWESTAVGQLVAAAYAG